MGNIRPWQGVCKTFQTRTRDTYTNRNPAYTGVKVNQLCVEPVP
jgi:hypothetical protein